MAGLGNRPGQGVRGGVAQRVAFNLATSHFRRRQAERRAIARLGRVRDVAEDADVGDAVTVRAALLQLPPKPRAVLVLRYYAGLDVASTASALGIPPGTVMTHTRRGLARLRLALGHSVEVELEEVGDCA